MKLPSDLMRGDWAARLESAWTRLSGRARRAAPVLVALVALYGIWPCATLWTLHLAVMREDSDALAALVDLEAVRNEIARRLNKECDSVIGELSDAFVDWIALGIRLSGTNVLRTQVTLQWVQDQLIAATAPGLGFLSAVSYCSFVSPRVVVVRMNRGDGSPVTLRLQLKGVRWRVTAVYY